MVLNAGHMANRLAGKATQVGPLRLLDNPIVTALLLTVLAMVIFFTLLQDDGCLADTGWACRLRVAIYVFVMTSVVLGLHYYAQKRTLGAHYKQSASDDFMSHLSRSQELSERGAHNPDHVPVFPGVGAHAEPEAGHASPAKEGAAEPAPSEIGELVIRPARINLLPQLPAGAGLPPGSA